MTKLFLIAATMLSAVTSPVVARDARPAASASVAAGAPAASPTRAPSSAQRYCVIETSTGSRIPHKTCMTRQQWLETGQDPLAKN